jgi:hypothetical protein
LRQGLKELLPPEVGGRTDKAAFDSCWPVYFADLPSSWFASLKVCEMGWVDRRAALQFADRLSQPAGAGQVDLSLWPLFAVETWLRTIARGRAE